MGMTSRLVRLPGRLWKALALDLRDVHFYSGLLLISYGVWLAWRPAAFMTAGLGLVYIALRRSG